MVEIGRSAEQAAILLRNALGFRWLTVIPIVQEHTIPVAHAAMGIFKLRPLGRGRDKWVGLTEPTCG